MYIPPTAPTTSVARSGIHVPKNPSIVKVNQRQFPASGNPTHGFISPSNNENAAKMCKSLFSSDDDELASENQV